MDLYKICLGGCISYASYDNSPEHGIYQLDKTNFRWHRVGEFPHSACMHSSISLVEMKDVLPFCVEKIRSSVTTTTTTSTTTSTYLKTTTSNHKKTTTTTTTTTTTVEITTFK